MRVVYLDLFLVLNFTVNYLLLACAARLDGGAVCRWRTVLAAAAGAAYGALALLPGLALLEHPVCKGGAAAGMLLAAFGPSARLARRGALFLVLSCAFGRPAARVVYVAFALYFALSAFVPMNEQQAMVHEVFYDTIPSLFIFLPFFFFSAYAGSRGLTNAGRTAEICLVPFVNHCKINASTGTHDTTDAISIC